MFGSVIDKAGGLLSRSFVLANFFPFVIFTGACLVMAWVTLPDTRPALVAVWGMEPARQAVVLVVALIAIAVVAYVVSPLTVVVRRILEGDWFVFRGLQDLMRAEERKIADDLKDQRDEANERDTRATKSFEECHRQLIEARRASRELKILGPQAKKQIADAEQRLAEAKQAAPPGHAADDDTIKILREAVELIVAALRSNSTKLDATAPKTDHELSLRLVNCQMQATALLRQAVDDGQLQLVNAQEALRGRFARKGIWPTRIGNIRAAVESYGSDAYGIEFSFLWPRLKLALQKDEKAAALIEVAKAQVDFSLLMVLLCGLFTVGWIITLVCYGGSPLAIILVGVLGQWTIFFFLRVVEESVKQLGELVGATIDFYRFKILREMDVDLPGNLLAERMLWRRLQQSSTTGLGTIDIAYRHGKP